ncbi:MAG: 4-hydroxy-3-methylbut-2-enyl diphosphate reductase [Methylacidiphilales bacterium]|nr:4-hydroxy-3-methylbut-2-enyl diphosphate reductase [Candidatus Methylacidiphilales bacterium]
MNPNEHSFKIYIANPRGFCAGVQRAVEVVEKAVALFPPPIYVKHEVVHNTHVVQSLTNKGVRFIEDIQEVPEGAVLIFSAHGVSQAVQESAKNRNLTIYDATCPLVTKVHMEVKRYSGKGMEIILIGHANHPEVIGTLGQASAHTKMYLVQNKQDALDLQVTNPDHLAYVTQTTLSLDETKEILTILKQRFPKLHAPNKEDICYATQNRQDAVKKLIKLCNSSGLILVIGSRSSSNSNRLTELAKSQGVTSYLIEDANSFNPTWLTNVNHVGVTAGASAPEYLVEELIAMLKKLGGKEASFTQGFNETVSFSLPKGLQN